MYQYKYCPQCSSKLINGLVEGQMRDYCQGCGFVHYLNPIPATGAIAIKDGQLVLIERNVEPGKGKWSIPSGFIDAGETPEEACLRELKEETGLTGTIREMLGVYSQQARIYGPVLVIIFLVDNLTGVMSAADDARDVKLVRFEQVESLHFPCFNEAFQLAREILKEE